MDERLDPRELRCNLSQVSVNDEAETITRLSWLPQTSWLFQNVIAMCLPHWPLCVIAIWHCHHRPLPGRCDEQCGVWSQTGWGHIAALPYCSLVPQFPHLTSARTLWGSDVLMPVKVSEQWALFWEHWMYLMERTPGTLKVLNAHSPSFSLEYFEWQWRRLSRVPGIPLKCLPQPGQT